MHDFLNLFLQKLGINANNDALISIAMLIAFGLGLLVTKQYYRRQAQKLKSELQQEHTNNQRYFDDQLDQLTHTFNSLSQSALQQNNQSFLLLAKQSFENLQTRTENQFSHTEKNVADLVQPIQKSLQQTDTQLKQLQQDRQLTESKLNQQINHLLESQHTLQSETRNLVTALRRPEIRGQWGELTLKRLVELAGMSAHCDFDEQVSVATEGGLLRPDMLINLPNERQLVVDVKTPLDAYLSATESTDAKQQSAFLEQHCRNVKQRIKELAQKQYWQQFKHAPDFVILFIPGDQFLSAALDQDKTLLEYALKQRILLATPTSLVGLLRAVAYGWSQDTLSKNTEQMHELGQTLYKRLNTLSEHINKLGKQLDSNAEQFNKLVGSYDNNVLPSARKLYHLGLSEQAPTEVSVASSKATRQSLAIEKNNKDKT